MAKIPGNGNTVPFPTSDGTYDPNQISEDLRKRIDFPTIPDQPQNLPTRRGRVTEVVKEMIVWELRHYLDDVNSPNDLLPVPVVMKFASDLPNPYQELDPLETVLRIVRAFPDIMERLPYVGVVATAGKNVRLAAGGKYVAPVLSPPRLVAGTGPFAPPIGPPAIIPPQIDTTAFNDNEVPGVPGDWPNPTGGYTLGLTSSDWVEITTVVDGIINVEVFQFTNTLVGISPQSPRTIADAINFSALYCHADVVLINGVPTFIIEPGGPVGNAGSYYEIFRSNASANFDAYVNLPLTKLIAPSNQFPMKNRYMNSMEMTIGLIIGTDGDTLRTEITDIIQNFFAFVMNTRQFTFWGRSFYGNTPDEFYQIVIKDNDINVIGEQETPRPDDPIRKIYVNRIDVPVLLFQYIDRPIQQGAQVVPIDVVYVPPLLNARAFAGIAQFIEPNTYRIACQARLNQPGFARFSGTATFDHRFAGIANFDVVAPFAQIATLSHIARLAHFARLVASVAERGLAGIAQLEVALASRIAHLSSFDAPSFGQIAELASLTYIGGESVAHTSELEAAVSIQFAQLASFDDSSDIVIAQLATLEAAAVELDAQVSTLEAAASTIIAQLSELESAAFEQVAQLSELDAIAVTTVAQLSELEAAAFEQVAQLSELEAAASEQVAQLSELEAAVDIRFAEIVELLPTTRIAGEATFEKSVTINVAQLAVLWPYASPVQPNSVSQTAHLTYQRYRQIAEFATLVASPEVRLAGSAELLSTARLAHVAEPTYIGNERIADMADLEAAVAIKVAGISNFEAAVAVTMAELADLEAAVEVSIAGSAAFDRHVTTRLAQSAQFVVQLLHGIACTATLTWYDEPRFACDAQPTYIGQKAFANIAKLEAMVEVKWSNTSTLEAAVEIGFAGTATLDKIMEVRIASMVDLDKIVESRVSELADLEASAEKDIAQTAKLEASAEMDIAQTADLDKNIEVRVAGTVELLPPAKFAQTVDFDKNIEVRVAGTVDFDKNIEVRVAGTADLSHIVMMAQTAELEAIGSEGLAELAELV